MRTAARARLHAYDLAEQPGGPEDEHGDHHDEDEAVGGLRPEEDGADRLEHAHEQPGEHGAGDAAQAAHDDDEKRHQDGLEPHARVQRVDGRHEGARDGGEDEAQRHAERGHPVGVDAEHAGGLLVLFDGPHGEARLGAVHEQVQPGHQHEGDAGGEEALAGQAHAEELHDPRQVGGDALLLDAEDDPAHGLDHERDADRGHHELQPLAAEGAKDPSLHGDAEQHRQQHDGGQGGDERQTADHVEIEHGHRAQHVDLAVREVDDVQDPVDQREPEGHEDVEDPREHADGQPLCQEREIDLHVRRRPPSVIRR